MVAALHGADHPFRTSCSDPDRRLSGCGAEQRHRPSGQRGSPQVPSGQALQYYRGRIYDANDPVGDAQPGSAWPEFGLAYVRKTGRRILFVPTAVPASSMDTKGDFLKMGHWDSDGKLFADSVRQTDDALKAAGPTARFAGVLWDQGEADAFAINLHFETAPDYGRLLSDLISRYRQHFGSSMPFFIFESGATTEKDQTGMEAVRSVQSEVSARTKNAPIVFKDAVTFVARGMMARNGAHYSQAGYNEMGYKGALAVADFLEPGFETGCRR